MLVIHHLSAIQSLIRRGQHMTNPARITQADMDRACKAVKAAGFDQARIVMDLDVRIIEIIIGDRHSAVPASEPNEWDRE